MQLFNRIVVVIVLLLLISASTLLLLIPDIGTRLLETAVDNLLGILGSVGQPTRMIMLLAAVLLDVLFLGLLFLEVRRRPMPSARVTRVKGIEGEVTLEAVRQRVEHHVEQIADIVEVRPRVGARGGRVEVALDVVTSPHVNVPSKIDEILQVVREVVTGGLGLKLRGKPTISIRHVEYGREARATQASDATPPDGVALKGISGEGGM